MGFGEKEARQLPSNEENGDKRVSKSNLVELWHTTHQFQSKTLFTNEFGG